MGRQPMDRVVRRLMQNYAPAFRYVLTSAAVYAFILVALYLLVDLAGMSPTPAYVVVLLAAYLIEYTATLLFVFQRSHSWGNVARYLFYVVLFLTISTALYDAIRMAGVHYLLSALLTPAILMPLRFFFNKWWVYR